VALADHCRLLDRRFTTLPIVSALMLTDCFGWILPLAETMDSRSRASIFSNGDRAPVVRLNPRLAYAEPAQPQR
jgi:hypothetical protein